MYINICKWCKKELEFDKQQNFAAHIGSCLENPNHLVRIQKSVETRKKLEIENRIYLNCYECGLSVMKKTHEIKKSKSGNVFCNSSCSATYNNKNKKTGTRRSKLEFWIEEQLKKIYKFEIIFNGKDAIKSELDIFIPSLNLAFELNGIFHYEAIYGDKKFESIKNNDNRKFQNCLENGIELCIIDTSSSKHFKPERDKKYLDIITKIIDNNMTTTTQQQPQQQITRTD